MTTPLLDDKETSKGMLMSVGGAYPPVLSLIDGWVLTDAVSDGFQSVTERFNDGLEGTFEGMLDVIISLVVYSPTPEREGGFGSEPTDSFWQAVYNSADRFVEIAVPLLVLGILLVLIFSTIGLVGEYRRGKIVTHSIVALLALVAGRLYFDFSILLLQIVDAIVRFVMPPMTGEGGVLDAFASSLAVSGGNPLVLSIVMLGMFLTLLLLLFISIVRIVGLFILLGTMPLLILLWGIGLGPLSQFGRIGKKGFNWFISLAIFPIPAAVAFYLGVHFMSSASATLPVAGEESFAAQVAMLSLGLSFVGVGVLGGILMTKVGGAVGNAIVKGGAAAAATYIGGPSAGAAVVSRTGRSLYMAKRWSGGAQGETKNSGTHPTAAKQESSLRSGGGTSSDLENEVSMSDEPRGTPQNPYVAQPVEDRPALPAAPEPPLDQPDPGEYMGRDKIRSTIRSAKRDEKQSTSRSGEQGKIQSAYESTMTGRSEVEVQNRVRQGNRETARITAANSKQSTIGRWALTDSQGGSTEHKIDFNDIDFPERP